MKQRHLWTAVGMVSCVLALTTGVLVGCGESPTRSTALDEGLVDIGADPPTAYEEGEYVPISYFDFQRDVWESAFSAPFLQSDFSYVLEEEIVALGAYQGVTNTSTRFTLEVEDLDYYTTTDLVSLATTQEEIAHLNDHQVTMALVTANLIGDADELLIEGIATHGVLDGSPFYHFTPRDYPAGNALFQGSFPPLPEPASGRPAPPEGEWSLRDASSFFRDADAVQGCIDRSEVPQPTANEGWCPEPLVMDQDCRQACLDEYNDTMDGHISEFCTDVYGTGGLVDTYNTAISRCRRNFIKCEIAASIACIANPWGCVAHIACIEANRDCRNDAKDDLDTGVARENEELQGQFEEAWSDFFDCLRDCCVEKKKEREIGEQQPQQH